MDELQRDAQLMEDLRSTDMWKCLVRQFKKMEARALAGLVGGAASDMNQVNFWRGQVALSQEVQKIPDLIIQWAEDAKENQAGI